MRPADSAFQKEPRSSCRESWLWRPLHWLAPASSRRGSPRWPRPSARTCAGSTIPIQGSARQNSLTHPLFCTLHARSHELCVNGELQLLAVRSTATARRLNAEELFKHLLLLFPQPSQSENTRSYRKQSQP